MSFLIFGCGGGGDGRQDIDAADQQDPGYEKSDDLPADESAGEDIIPDDFLDFQEEDFLFDEEFPEEEVEEIEEEFIELPEPEEFEEMEDFIEAESEAAEETGELAEEEQGFEKEFAEEYVEYEEEFQEDVEVTFCEPYPECLFAKLCQPCKFDEECEIASGGGKPLCVIYGEIGRFCGAPCKDNSGCPEGYECKSAQSH
ncbi:MAG: hypothetical protein FJ088_12135, partial [Deltaproteobacteria bacterium]|nr:hypothetical protein [Deltaproteobacteria bacterium]